MLWHVLDKATTMIGEYLDMELRFHTVWDEVEQVMGPQLPVFPKLWPARSVLAFQIIAWIQQGAPQTWTLPTNVLQKTVGGATPYAFGNVEVDRTMNMMRVSSYAGALGFPWSAVLGSSGEIHFSYTAGFDNPSPSAHNIAWSDVVAAVPAPTTTTFGLSKGYGALGWNNATIRVGGQQGTVLSIAGDVVTLTAPLAQAPTPGDIVEQDDPITMPTPPWLKENIRDTARFLVELVNATYGGATGIGQIQWGQVKWTLPSGTSPDL